MARSSCFRLLIGVSRKNCLFMRNQVQAPGNAVNKQVVGVPFQLSLARNISDSGQARATAPIAGKDGMCVCSPGQRLEQACRWPRLRAIAALQVAGRVCGSECCRQHWETNPERNSGGSGGESARTGRLDRLTERALCEHWRVPEATRDLLIERFYPFVGDPKAAPREVISACKSYGQPAQSGR